MTLRNTVEIFEILSKGKFICQNSTSRQVRAYYDCLEEDGDQYREYYAGVGFDLQSGKGYWYFCRTEKKLTISQKLEKVGHWIDILDFLKTFNPTFGSNFEFVPAAIMVALRSDLELKDKLPDLYPGVKGMDDLVSKLMAELSNYGFIELISEVDNTYRVTTAFHYMEELVDCIVIAEEAKDEIPQ